MRHLSILNSRPDLEERARYGLRVAVCRRCPARPQGSERLDAATPRACETNCSLFGEIPLLVRAARLVDPTIGSFDRMILGELNRLAQSERDTGNQVHPTTNQPAWLRHKGRIVRVLRDLCEN